MQACQKICEFCAGGIGLVPSGVVGGVCRQLRWRRHRRVLQVVRDVSAHRVGDLFKRVTAVAVDAEEVADTVSRHVCHVGESAIDGPVVAVIDEAIIDGPEVAQAVAKLHSVFRGPRAFRNFHAIDVAVGTTCLPPTAPRFK
jgi:hypothetical protein